MQRASRLPLGFSIYAEPTKTKIIDFARLAMDELFKLGDAGEPLWQPHGIDTYETLNDIEYLRQFGEVDATPREIVKLVEVGEPQSQHRTSKKNLESDLQIEASRDTTYVKMIPIKLVELLMDVNQWSGVFYDIVSRTIILATLLDGVEGSYDEKLHVMRAEFHLPSPIFPTRDCYFARYCKQLSEDTWGVVDVSLEKYFPSPLNKFRKRPSGCLITRMPNEYSKVTWVEHVEVDHSQISNLFKRFFTSGLAFGATRWLASLVRYTELCESLKATKLVSESWDKNSSEVLIPQIGRTGFLKLANRMMRRFCANVTGSTCHRWMQLNMHPPPGNVRVMVQNNMEATTNKSCGRLLVFTNTLFLNFSPNKLFHFLGHEKYRNEWDNPSRKFSFRELAHMIKGERRENRVSLLRSTCSQGKTQAFYLQESYTDSSVAYVISTSLNEETLINLANGHNSNYATAFPIGFTIIPGGLPRNGEGNTGGNDVGTGSILTIAFNITAIGINTIIPQELAKAIDRCITKTTNLIRNAMEHHTRLNDWVTD